MSPAFLYFQSRVKGGPADETRNVVLAATIRPGNENVTEPAKAVVNVSKDGRGAHLPPVSCDKASLTNVDQKWRSPIRGGRDRGKHVSMMRL